MSDEINRLLLLWGKTPRGKQKKEYGTDAYHPLLCHMIDVAMVARAMWHMVLTPALRRAIADGLGVDEEAAGRWVTFWAGLHDLGKASPTFQDQVPILQQAIAESMSLPFRTTKPSKPHGIITAITAVSILESTFNVEKPLAARIARVIGGHHGVFPLAAELRAATNADQIGRERGWIDARQALAVRLHDLLARGQITPPERLCNDAIMSLAGLVSVADWIGSDPYFFPLRATVSANRRIDPASYGRDAERSAKDALSKLGWLGWKPSDKKLSFGDLFEGKRPRPVQEKVIEIPGVSSAPGIVVLEAPMGEGKTEAALYLADRWGVALEQRGLYVAMPTMATSNQMFRRFTKYVGTRYPDDLINLQLIHSHANLMDDFKALQTRSSTIQPGNIDGTKGRDEAPSNVVAAEWFTKPKHGLLAPFAVGTVDQTFLAVLQTLHAFVRLFGLTHKTIIFDEVHAYDVYMSTLFDRLLRWLGGLGSSVVILSATLPEARRRALIEQYAAGAKGLPSGPVPYATYPRVTWLTGSGPGAVSVATSADSAKSLRIKWVDGQLPNGETGRFDLGERLKKALRHGGCVAVICNTVDRAQRVHEHLKPYFPGIAPEDGLPVLDLFHARFLFEHRQERENRTIRRFGKRESGQEIVRPYRAVLVATQVIEQSLDLDFDLMVSDFAPLDLLLQRSGRLHRHRFVISSDGSMMTARIRPRGLKRPTLWLCYPAISESGVPQFDPGTTAVYEDAHVLLRSWLELEQRKGAIIRIPQDVEAMIEAVYEDRACPKSLPETVRAAWTTTAATRSTQKRKHEGLASKVVILPPDHDDDILEGFNRQLEEEDPEVHEALRALTRLSEPTVSAVILTAEQAATIRRSHEPSYEEAKALLEKSVRIGGRGIVNALLAESVPSGWKKNALLRYHRLVILDSSGDTDIGSYRLQLDHDLGIVIRRRREE